ncbi:MAG: cupredoxin domain-containing protein [Alphaproteobacteria bacterium]|nr:cupredoxin domain-containing protein [Alphaproteobacteria bacterium]
MKPVTLLLLALLPTLALAEPPAPAAPPTAATPAEVKTFDVMVHGGAYHPARLEVPAGEPFRLRFTKHDHDGCTRDVVLPFLGERHTLPTGEAVVIEVPALEAGTYAFTCGMNMVKGTLVVTKVAAGGSDGQR